MGFGALDWSVFTGYFLILALTSWLFARFTVRSSRDYFVGARMRK